jgi:hypothetical protein
LKKLAGFDTGTSIIIRLYRLNSKDVGVTYLDAPSAVGATLIQQFTHTLTTSDWESVTCTTTSVLPSEAANGLLLHLDYSKTDMGASEKFAVAQVQLEPGTVATPFEFRPYGTELALCQRYYEKSYSQGVTPGTTTIAGIEMMKTIHTLSDGTAVALSPFKVEKRTSSNTKRFWTYNGVLNTVYYKTGATEGTVAVSSAGESGTTQAGFYCALAANTVYSFRYHWDCDAEL